MHLETDRLLIRPWREDEAPRLFEILSDPEITRWFGTPEAQTEVAQTVETIRSHDLMKPPRGVWAVALKQGDLAVGSVMLVEIPKSGAPGEELVQIGWYLHPDSTGHGYASEASRAVLDFGLAAGITEIRALTHLDNYPSIEVARRIGMRHLGQTDDWYDEPSEHFIVP